MTKIGFIGHLPVAIPKNELKTLKDLNIRRPKGIELPYIDHFKEELKQEAIKWVKYYLLSEIKERREIVKQFKHFFNLTEEDLK